MVTSRTRFALLMSALASMGCRPRGYEVHFERLRPCDATAEVSASSWRITVATPGLETHTFEAGGFPPSVSIDSTEGTTVSFEALDHRGAVIGRGTSEPFPGEPSPTVKVMIRPRGVFSRSCETLQTPRRGHTATFLSGSKVVVVGGYDEGGTALASVERLTEGRNEVLGALNASSVTSARAFHSAVRFSSTTVLVVGGERNELEFQNIAVVFDEETRSTGTLARPLLRARHTSAISPDGKRLLTVGGLVRDQAGLQLADSVELLALEKANDLQTSRIDAVREAAGAVGRGRVLLAGGEEAGAPSRRAFIASFTQPTRPLQLREPRREATAAALGDDFLVASGIGPGGNLLGSSEWLRANGTVEPGPPVAPRRRGCAVETRGGVLFLGGVDQAGAPVSSAELVATDGTVTAVAFAGSPRSEHTCTRLDTDTIVVVGGRGPVGILNDVWYFVP